MELSIQQVNSILKDYGLESDAPPIRLTSGYSNTNFKAETPKGPVLLRISGDDDLKKLEYEIKVLNKLRAQEFPAAFPLKRGDGTYITRWKEKLIVLYEFIAGKQAELNPQTVSVIGKAVAKLNLLTGWESLQRENSMNRELCTSVVASIDSAPESYHKLSAFFIEETNILKNSLGSGLPRGFVHGDVFSDNTIFQGNELKAIIDFEEVCTDVLIFDVGMTINGFCFRGTELDRDLLEAFLQSYDEVRPLQEKEKTLLPIYVRWCALTLMAWHLNHLLKKRDPRKIERATLHMNRILHIKDEW